VKSVFQLTSTLGGAVTLIGASNIYHFKLCIRYFMVYHIKLINTLGRVYVLKKGTKCLYLRIYFEGGIGLLKIGRKVI